MAALSPQTTKHRRTQFYERVRIDAAHAVDWRWRRAAWHVRDDRRFSRRRDDEPTGRAVAFMRDWSRCRTKRQISGLRRRTPAFFAAHALQQTPSRLRMIVEARLLAGQSVADVSHLVSLPHAVVEIYEAVFFQVSDWLGASDWILTQALGPNFFGLVAPQDVSVLVKGMAYLHGPVVLDAILSAVIDDHGQFSLANARDFQTEAGRLAVRTALCLMHQMARQTPALVRELDRIHDLIGQIERGNAASSAFDRDLTTLVDSFSGPPVSACRLADAPFIAAGPVGRESSEAGETKQVA